MKIAVPMHMNLLAANVWLPLHLIIRIFADLPAHALTDVAGIRLAFLHAASRTFGSLFACN